MKIDNYISLLKQVKLFKNLEESMLSDVFKELNYKILPYGKSDIIFTEDDQCKSLGIVLEGMVEIQKIDVFGKVLTIAQFTPSDIFGENLIFGDKNTFPMTVSSKTDTIILHIEKDSIVKLCQKSSDFLYEYLRIVSNRAMALSSKLKEVTLKTIRQKICGFILLQYSTQKTLKIVLPMTKKDWADKLGVQRPSLSRELIKMKEEGLIDYDKDIIIIKNLDALEAC
jgi:CRP/FNR family transcriptional regulator, dissimilatory nitrate respiration regulator